MAVFAAVSGPRPVRSTVFPHFDARKSPGHQVVSQIWRQVVTLSNPITLERESVDDFIGLPQNAHEHPIGYSNNCTSRCSSEKGRPIRARRCAVWNSLSLSQGRRVVFSGFPSRGALTESTYEIEARKETRQRHQRHRSHEHSRGCCRRRDATSGCHSRRRRVGRGNLGCAWNAPESSDPQRLLNELFAAPNARRSIEPRVTSRTHRLTLKQLEGLALRHEVFVHRARHVFIPGC